VCWTIVYDTIYAHQDKSDDVHAGVKSTALLFEDKSREVLTGFGTSFLGLLAWAGYMNGQGVPFYAMSVGGAAWHLARQVRNTDFDSREKCWEAFKSNRNLGAIVWGGMAADYLIAAASLAT
jgi:4-hydroxybenzoate polyprenyltransferase